MNNQNYIILLLLCISTNIFAQKEVHIWNKFERKFTSSYLYKNPIYNIKNFDITFISPTGIVRKVNGFWDGDDSWKVRFMPDELGEWTWSTICSDKKNSGLHNQQGSFVCIENNSELSIYKHGAVKHFKGKYFFSYNDGMPYLWVGCTAWNGALKSTDEEWTTYLNNRRKNNYSVIQLVTTQWRGCDKNSEGLVAYEVRDEMIINPEFFKRIDKKIDEVNSNGLLVSPVILWALHTGQGRFLNPGHKLPIKEATILAKYIVARYQGNHVIWALGGDGKYYDELECKWKKIGKEVFSGLDHAPTTLHTHARSYVGRIYADENWYNFMCYQSSHRNNEETVNWINKGPVANEWDKLKPMPYINMEPAYEELFEAEDIRNASWWSIFATPIAGITYGANGIWPWLRDGEQIQNHRTKQGTSTWQESLELPGNIQIGYLSEFIQKTNWWAYYPAKELLVNQPGNESYNAFVSIVATEDKSSIMVYIPKKCKIELRSPNHFNYKAIWYNPSTNKEKEAKYLSQNGILLVEQKRKGDWVLKLDAID